MTMTFWAALATYCRHLTPVVAPLTESVGDFAAAVDRANTEADHYNELAASLTVPALPSDDHTS
jgi:hypothetical protein